MLVTIDVWILYPLAKYSIGGGKHPTSYQIPGLDEVSNIYALKNKK
jgi:hypothetical protein